MAAVEIVERVAVLVVPGLVTYGAVRLLRHSVRPAPDRARRGQR